MIEIVGLDNVIEHPENVVLRGSVRGRGNRISFKSARVPSVLKIHINGDNNKIQIGDVFAIKELYVFCGNHVPANNTVLTIGDQFSVEPGSEIYLFNHNSVVTIGDDCLFSKNIILRCGESPHLIFDIKTGEYLDKGKRVEIGRHVWVGEDVYITKNAKIPDNVILGACSVVTKAFKVENCVIAGNPARVTKEGVLWIRNKDFIPKSSIYEEGYRMYTKEVR